MHDAAVWIRAEDAEHPKLERLRRSVTVSTGPEADASRPWLVWGSGLARGGLFHKLEIGAQILILPPWPEGGFAGLPAVRTHPAPSSTLALQSEAYTVGATCAIESTPAWQGHGLFASTTLSWLVAHEPYVGAGKAWLCTAELLVASPTTRPREARRLITALVTYLTCMCREKPQTGSRTANDQEPSSEAFSRDDVPYLLAILGLDDTVDIEMVAQCVYRRFGVEPDMDRMQRVMANPEIQTALAQPMGARPQLAKVVDDFGFRSYRIEIEETAR